MKDTSKDIFNTIAERAQNVSLSDKEKAALFRSVDSYVRKHPIVTATPSVQPTPAKKVVSPLSGVRWFSYLGANHSSSLSFALVVFVVLGAGTSFAAQGSLPGDLLYAVKIGVNEQVRAALSSDVGKAVYEATRAVERLKEGQALEAQGKLTPELQTQIEARFEEHAARVQKDTEQFTEKGEYTKALQVSEKFETVLKKEEPAIEGVFAPTVKSTIEASAFSRAETENSIATAVVNNVNTDEIRKVATEKQTAARAAVTRVSTSIATRASSAKAVSASASIAPVAPTAAMSAKKSSLTAAKIVAPAVTTVIAPDTATLTSKNTLSIAEALLKQGDDAFAAQKYNEAFNLYRQAQDVASQAEALLIKTQ